MIGLDTNVLVRYIVQDDPEQARLATRALEAQCTAKSPGRINVIVLCELIWVLARGYGYGRQVVSLVIRRILSSPELLVEEDEAVWKALKVYEQGTADFSDYLLGLLNHRAGASPTLTFDRKAAKESFFELLI
ncbi:MAG: PIN domain-containing protein [Verrucomicrobia bacterium]|nr:MAG: PIN domain-containing protein [Verrucomicrobiota bacterium]